jgi:transglutaminase-like putative cysteine protease
MNKPAILLFALGIGGVAAAGYAIYRDTKRRPALSGSTAKYTLLEATSKGPKRKLTQFSRSSMSIDQRMEILQGVVEKSVKDPAMRKLALQITRHCPARDGTCEAKAIGDWVKKNIRYTGDVGPIKLAHNGQVEGVDVFQTAARTVEFGGGDCDDHTILNATLAAHNGLTSNMRITSPTRDPKEEDYSHIYDMIGLPKNDPRKYYAVDTTLPNYRFGYEVPYGKSKDYPA